MDFSKASIETKISFIKKICHNKDVLDIGCVGQDNDYSSELWVHKHIKSVTSKLTGVDINRKGIAEARALGYEIIHADEISEKKYEVITMLDVIEHVDDICAFILNYKKHLSEEGRLIITTPNPFNIRQFFNILLFKKPSINPEHTTFIDPINFIEISKRVDMKIVDFLWLKEYDKPTRLYMKILRGLIFPIFLALRKHFNANYAIILSH